MEIPVILTVGQTAKILNCSPATVCRKCRLGLIKHMPRVGKEDYKIYGDQFFSNTDVLLKDDEEYEREPLRILKGSKQ